MACDRGKSAALVHGVVSHAAGVKLPKTLVCDTAVPEADKGKFVEPEAAAMAARTMFESIGVNPDTDPVAKALVTRMETGRIPVTAKLERAMRSRFPEAVNKAREDATGTPSSPSQQVLSTAAASTFMSTMGAVGGYRPSDIAAAVEQIRQEEAAGTLDLSSYSPNKYLTPTQVRELITAFAASEGTDDKISGILQQADNGQLVISQRDAAAVTIAINRVKDIEEENSTLDKLQPLDGEWVDSVTQRHCTICGQFVGRRGEHGASECKSANPAAHRERFIELDEQLAAALKTHPSPYGRMRYPKYRELITIGELYEHRGLRDIFVSYDSDKLPDLSEDEFADAYAAYPELRGRLLMSKLQKQGFLGRGTETLPLTGQERDAFLEYPTLTDRDNLRVDGISSEFLALVAARVEPPLNDIEVGRLITIGAQRGLLTLLSVRKTREQAIRYITEYPSETAFVTAQSGKFDTETLTSMATSGDPRVRLQAAVAPNTPQETLALLATDPDPAVRLALATTVPQTPIEQIPERDRGAIAKGRANRDGSYDSRSRFPVTNNPQIASILINDPDPDIANTAFRNAASSSTVIEGRTRVSRNCLTPTHVTIASAITNPDRLDEIKLEVLTDTWTDSDALSTDEYKNAILNMEI